MLIPATLLDRHGSFYRSFVVGSVGWQLVSPSHTRMAPDAVFGMGFLQKSGTGADSHNHDPSHYSAIYVLSGRGTYRDSTGATGIIGPGTVFQRLCGRRHTAIFDPSVRYVEAFLAFSPWMMAQVSRILNLEQRPVVQTGIDLALIRDLSATMDALQAARERELPRVYLQCLGLLTALFTTTGQDADGASVVDWIDEACRLLAEEAEGRFPVAQVAQRLGMGYELFRKEFRSRMGVSPGDYRIRRRMDRARELLVATHDSIKEIAYALGYPNPSVFSLQFKREVGSSPEHYRRRGS